MTIGTTERLAKFVVDTGFKEMPEEVVTRTKTMFIDTIGVALAGASVGEAGKITLKYIKDIGGVPESTIIGGGFRSSAPNAAFVNGLLAHALDFDDWEPSGHPSCMLVASSLALGEKLGLPGKALVEAFVLGLEVYDKIAAGCPNIRFRGWHGTGIFGTMGATAVAAKLLGLNVQQTNMAFGVAASGAGGILCQFGTMTKSYHTGNAARNGIEAALLARDGFTSQEAIIEFPSGFCDCFAGKNACDYTKMTHNLGNPFHIISPGLGLKPYPCWFPSFRGVDAILELKNEHGFTYDDVDRVEISVANEPFIYRYREPKTWIEAKFSINYAVAAALLDDQLTLATFSNDKVSAPKMQKALGKVKVVVDAAIPKDKVYAWMPVTVRLKDGSTFSKRIDIPRGDPRNPLPVGDILAKYRSNASLVLDEERVQRSLNLLQNLEKADNLRELADILITPVSL